MTVVALLREDLDSLTALVQRAAAQLGIDATFLEKDFWVTELLRAVSQPISIQTKDGDAAKVEVIFKGGTSLSRVFELTSRFSEDVDLLIKFPENTSINARDKVLKRIAASAQAHLGLPDDATSTGASTTGVKRNVEFRYPRRASNPAIKEHLLLEMGSRGGSEPHERHELRSLVAQFAIEQLGEPTSTWPEFEPVRISVLGPERTLLEKCALVHDLATRVEEGDTTAESKLLLAGRHYYDIAKLLDSDKVRLKLTEMGREGVQRLAHEIDVASEAAGWPHAARPGGGYGASPAFQPDAVSRVTAEESYQAALAMVYRDHPTFSEVLATVETWGYLL